MPKVDRAPRERPRRNTKTKSSPTQQREASLVKDASADLKDSLITTPSSPESISGDEDDSEEEIYDSLTSHTTASDSTSADLLTSTASAVEDISSKPPSVTESQFSSLMPYLEESTKPGQTQDSVLQNNQNIQANILVIQPYMLHCLQAFLNHQPQEGVQRRHKGSTPCAIWEGVYIQHNCIQSC